MKRIDDIEKMSLNELMNESAKTDVKAPDDIEAGIRSRIRRSNILHGAYGIAVAASLAAVLTLGLGRMPGQHDSMAGLSHGNRTELVDTYDDPALAYAEVERALGKFSSALNSGAEQAAEGEQMFMDQKQFVKNIAQ